VEITALTRSAPVEDAAPPPAASPQGLPDLHVARPRWLVNYTAVLVVLDAAAMAAATLTAKISWLGIEPEELQVRSFDVPYVALGLVTVPTWLVLLALTGAYDLGPFGTRSRGWQHIVRAGAQLLAVIAVSYYFLHLATLGRGVLAGLIPLAVVLTLAGRAAASVGLDALRRRKRAQRSALVLGSRRSVEAFVEQLSAHPATGVKVVGVSLIRDGDSPDAHGTTHPPASLTESEAPGTDTTGTEPTNGAGTNGATSAAITTHHPYAHRSVDWCAATEGYAEFDASGPGDTGEHAPPPPLMVSEALAQTQAETLIVTGGVVQGQLREIAWMLEGTGIELLVTPTPADAHGLRAEIRPVAGLPLLYVDT
jgi:hypothetical protein